jgi:hypothetical protein
MVMVVWRPGNDGGCDFGEVRPWAVVMAEEVRLCGFWINCRYTVVLGGIDGSHGGCEMVFGLMTGLHEFGAAVTARARALGTG